jgi:hypothetical protein
MGQIIRIGRYKLEAMKRTAELLEKFGVIIISSRGREDYGIRLIDKRLHRSLRQPIELLRQLPNPTSISPHAGFTT